MDTSKYVQVGETLSGAHCTHTESWVCKLAQPRRFYSELQIGYPWTYAQCEASVRNTFSESTSGVPTTPMPTDWSQGFQPNTTEWDECGARVAKSRGFLAVQGLECATICILTNGWQLWTNLYWKLWALHLTRRCLNSFFQGGGNQAVQ